MYLSWSLDVLHTEETFKVWTISLLFDSVKYNKLTDVGAQSLGVSLRNCKKMKTLRWGNPVCICVCDHHHVLSPPFLGMCLIAPQPNNYSSCYLISFPIMSYFISFHLISSQDVEPVYPIRSIWETSEAGQPDPLALERGPPGQIQPHWWFQCIVFFSVINTCTTLQTFDHESHVYTTQYIW